LEPFFYLAATDSSYDKDENVWILKVKVSSPNAIDKAFEKMNSRKVIRNSVNLISILSYSSDLLNEINLVFDELYNSFPSENGC
jgi:hypothetical protein